MGGGLEYIWSSVLGHLTFGSWWVFNLHQLDLDAVSTIHDNGTMLVVVFGSGCCSFFPWLHVDSAIVVPLQTIALIPQSRLILVCVGVMKLTPTTTAMEP